HYTALIFLPVYWLLNEKKKYNLGFLKKSIFYLAFILLIVFFESFFSWFTQIDVFSKYSYYKLGNRNFVIGHILVRLPVVLIIVLNLKKIKHQNKFAYNMTTLYFVSILLLFLETISPWFGRIAIFFEMSQIIIISSIVKLQGNKYAKLFYSSTL